MTAPDLKNPKAWSTAFGLADAPLFGSTEREAAECHCVMLDGGHGTFALSIIEDGEIETETAASWIWSADVPHHVAVASDRVTVTRWDMVRENREFTPESVAQRFDTFYRFLVQDRVQQGQSVVAHLVDQFRMVRTALSQAGEDDQHSLGVFLALLSALIEEQLPSTAPTDNEAVSPEATEIFARIRERQLAPLLERARHRRSSRADLELYSTLAVRHAGGLIFQEAHFELIRTPPPDLFGYLGESELKPVTRGGAHFTPPPLARSVVDQTLLQFSDLARLQRLVLVDPACGSGAFLHEAIRGLDRAGFQGHLQVVGRDISNHAVAMARFALARARHDWSPQGGMSCDIQVEDSLADDAIPEADIIVMNPPFVALGSLDAVQQDHIDRILGGLKKGRPDLSMAFVLRAVSRLKPGGALGCLFPASLLELQSAAPWRRAVHEQAGLRFLSMIGDHGLFTYALIQVAAAVFKKEEADATSEILTLWTADDKEATGEALRALRTIARKGPSAAEDRKNWRVSWVSRRSVETAPSWRLRAPKADRLLIDVRESVGSVVKDLFDVRQGILTGSNNAFIITDDEWSVLTKGERSLFKPALMNKSIEDGQFLPIRYVFYPYAEGRLLITDEGELERRLPNYSRKLFDLKDRLAARPRIGSHWWALAERRVWMNRVEARIVSKYFGGLGAFCPDVLGNIAVVQGYAWLPAERLKKASALLPADEFSKNLVCAYAALLNSHVFVRLLDSFAPRVAGGQFNLSRRYVCPIPLPDLAQQVLDKTLAPEIRDLDSLGRTIATADPKWIAQVDDLAARVFRIPLEHWK